MTAETNTDMPAPTIELWTELIEEGNEHYSQNRSVKAEQSFIKGLEMARELLKLEEKNQASQEEGAVDKDGLKSDLERAKNRVAKSANNLAALYHAQGKFGFAEPLYEKSLDIKLELYGQEHLETALNLHNLAMLHSARRKFEKAEILYQRTIEIREALLGKEHKDLVPVLKNYALLLQKTNRQEESKEFAERAAKLEG